MDRSEIFSCVEGNIIKYFSFLLSLGYELYSIDDQKLTRYSKDYELEVVFVNNKINRLFKITYMYKGGHDGTEIINNFSFKISNGKGDLNVDHYVRQKEDIKYFWLNSFEGDFEERVTQLFEYVIDLMKRYLMPIIKGEDWVDMPFNWYSAK
jgi:hypothetical protein